MSTDLLSLAKGALGSGGIGKLAGLLGESEERTSNAFNIAGSAVLAGLMQKASTPDGAQGVFDKLSGLNDGVLDSVGQMISGSVSSDNADAVSSLGSKLIGDLFGDKLESLMSMVAKLTGIGDSSSKSLLSMLAPLLLGTVAKQTRDNGLDVAGFSKLLTEQKSSVTKYLPDNFSQKLGLANLADDSVAEEAYATVGAAADSGSILRFAIPLAIVAGFGFLVWKMTSTGEADKPTQTVAEDSTPDERITVQRPPLPDFDLTKIGSQVETGFGTLIDTVTDIKDVDSAHQAIPRMEALTKELSQYDVPDAPEGFQAKLGEMLKPMIEKLKSAVATASRIPGVKEVLEPVLGPLMKVSEAYTNAI